MNAAIQTIQATLEIRQIQLAQFEHSQADAYRVPPLRDDIAALERSLKVLESDGKLLTDLEFLARMLHQFVVVLDFKTNFHICEAYEVAKKYLPNSENIDHKPSTIPHSPECPTIGDPAGKSPEACECGKTGDR